MLLSEKPTPEKFLGVELFERIFYGTIPLDAAGGPSWFTPVRLASKPERTL
jgi:hypothetical protein